MSDQPIQTIRLSSRDRRKLVDVINQQGARGKQNTERRNIRVDYHAEGVIVAIRQPHGNTIQHAVVPRNLSRWGIAFVHGRFVYPDVTCDVTLPTLEGKSYIVPGKVVRCRHIGGIVHEVSVVFNEPVDLDLFVTLNAEQREQTALEQSDDPFNADTDPTDTAGMRAMVVDDVRSDRKLFGLYLTEMGLSVSEAVGAAQALNLAMRDRMDMILINCHLADHNGAELVKHLRNEKVNCAIIGMSSSENETIKQEMIAAGASAFLVKPFQKGALKELVEQLLALDTDAGRESDAIISTETNNATMRPIIEEFVSGLGTYIARLHNASNAEDYDHLAKVCQQLKGSGGGYGFEVITQAAQGALGRLESNERDADAIRRQVNELLSILRRVRFE